MLAKKLEEARLLRRQLRISEAVDDKDDRLARRKVTRYRRGGGES
jgi:hypothetical protein